MLDGLRLHVAQIGLPYLYAEVVHWIESSQILVAAKVVIELVCVDVLLVAQHRKLNVPAAEKVDALGYLQERKQVYDKW